MLGKIILVGIGVCGTLALSSVKTHTHIYLFVFIVVVFIFVLYSNYKQKREIEQMRSKVGLFIKEATELTMEIGKSRLKIQQINSY